MSMSKNLKENDEELVWYLSYGSNLLEERFLCYIEGGTPPGSKSFHSGSRDKRKPIQSKGCFLRHEMVFARESATWQNGGVAFIKEKATLCDNCDLENNNDDEKEKNNSKSTTTTTTITTKISTKSIHNHSIIENQSSTCKCTKTPARRYLIRKQQFFDVVSQELGLEPCKDYDLTEVLEKGVSTVSDIGWYSRIVLVAMIDGVPCFTFTSPDFDSLPINPPSKAYHDVILNGIKETHNFNHQDALTVLSPKVKHANQNKSKQIK